jgi:hypothetical protein
MPSENLNGYEIWDLSPADCYPHSHLYHLEPIGIGTPNVECLTGYIARLAQAHGVTPHQLILHQLASLYGRKQLIEPSNQGFPTFWKTCSPALNSFGRISLDMVDALQSLTLCQDLIALTLLTWANVFPIRGLIRRNRVWCPVCYETWRQMGKVVYDPLLWTLDVITICTEHRCHLRNTCPSPDCQAPQLFLDSHSVPGHCSRCGQWLGMESGNPNLDNTAISDEEWRWQTWLAAELGTLLASVPTLEKEPDVKNVFDALTNWINLETQGSCPAFARKWQISTTAVRFWKNRQQKPQLDLLLRFCHFYGSSLLSILLEGSKAKTEVGLEQRSRVFRPKPPKYTYRAFDHELVQTALRNALANDIEPPLSVRKICTELGYKVSQVYGYYPDLCRAVSGRLIAYQKERGKQRLQRMEKEIRQAVFTIHNQGKYPSARRIQQILSEPGIIRHQHARKVWHEALCELGWES